MRMSISDVEEALGVHRQIAGRDAHATSREGEEAGLIFTGVSTDTRTIKRGDLFVALKNDKADGHDFIGKAINAGAAGVVVHDDVGEIAVPVFRVEDTQIAYGLLARWWRSQFDIPVIGVTGSVGKTTTKEMLVTVLSPLGPILKTEASQNNETGVPKALLGLTSEHKAAVVEMGMRGVGQITYLCTIAEPTMGVITLIAENHIELLGSRDAIADAKGELFGQLSKDGTAFVNANDPYYKRLADSTYARKIGFAVEGAPTYGPPDLTATDLHFVDGRWGFKIGDQPIVLSTPARHDVSNATAAFAVAVTLGVDPAEAAAALATFAPPPMRMQIVEASGWGGTVLNDAYNAAPASMRSALETLATYPHPLPKGKGEETGGRKIAFLGDMRELGDIGPEEHAKLGDTIASIGGLDALYTVGELAGLIPNAVRRFTTSIDAAEFVKHEMDLRAGDVVLVKGSRAMAMEKVANALVGKGAQ